jgi:hypothetical protein
MTLRFQVFMFLMIAGLLAITYETLAFVIGEPVNWPGLMIVLGVFLVGLIGTSIMWKREARGSFRAAVRKSVAERRLKRRRELSN